LNLLYYFNHIDDFITAPDDSPELLLHVLLYKMGGLEILIICF